MSIRSVFWQRSFIAVNGGAFFAFATNHVVGISLPLYIASLGGTAFLVGVVSSVTSAAALGSRLGAGQLIAARGNRSTLLLGVMVFLLGPVLLVLSSALWGVLVAALFQGVGFALINTAHFAYVADLAPKASQGRFLGIAGMVMPASLAIFPLLTSLALQDLSFVTVFAVAGGLTVAALASFLLVTRTHQHAAVPAERRVDWRAWLELLRDPDVRAPLLVSSTVGLADGALLSFLPLYAVELGVAQFGLFFTVFSLCLIAAQGVVGVLIDRTSPAGVGLVSLVVFVAAFTALSFPLNLGGLLGVAVAAAVGFGGVQTAMMVLVVRAAGGDSGRSLGLFYAVFDVGRISGLIGLGAIASWLGYGGLYLLLALGIGAFGLYLVRWQAGRRSG